jgi:hypothetical protein
MRFVHCGKGIGGDGDLLKIAQPSTNLSNTAGYHLGSLSCSLVVRSAHIGSAGVRFSLIIVRRQSFNERGLP